METFRQIAKTDPIQLDYAMLLIAREIRYSNLNIEASLAQLEGFARTVAARIKVGDTIKTKLYHLNNFLFDEQGFRGNEVDYYNPRNSFLNDVLERRIGIPITLSIIYMSIAERLGLRVYGIGLPGHFIVGCESDQGKFYLDPFYQGLILNKEECIAIVQNYQPVTDQLIDVLLIPQTNRMILLRVLNNLRHIYRIQTDSKELLRVLHLQQALVPNEIDLHRDIGVLYFHQNQWGEAVKSLRQYVYLRPDAPDIELVRALLQEALKKLSWLN